MHFGPYMMNWGSWMPFGGWMGGYGGILMLALILWSLAWKGMALWKASKANSQGWFIALLLVNTFGILDILYIYVFSEQKKK